VRDDRPENTKAYQDLAASDWKKNCNFEHYNDNGLFVKCKPYTCNAGEVKKPLPVSVAGEGAQPSHDTCCANPSEIRHWATFLQGGNMVNAGSRGQVVSYTPKCSPTAGIKLSDWLAAVQSLPDTSNLLVGPSTLAFSYGYDCAADMVGVDGAKAVGSFISNGKVNLDEISVLDISGAKIGDEGGEAIVHGFSNHKKGSRQTVVDFRDNGIDKAGWDVILKILCGEHKGEFVPPGGMPNDRTDCNP